LMKNLIDYINNWIFTKWLKSTSQTAAIYLDKLAESGLLKMNKIGKSNYYINEPLFLLFKNFDLSADENYRLWWKKLNF
jgi:hypothetical protein